MTNTCRQPPRLKGYVRKCLFCDKTERNETGWKEHWRKYKDGYVCNTHYQKYVNNPRRPKEYYYNSRKQIQQRIIEFCKLDIILTFNPRKGYCKLCSNNIHDGSCKLTSLHHWFYLRIMPWACTIEICNSCHMKITRKV